MSQLGATGHPTLFRLSTFHLISEINDDDKEEKLFWDENGTATIEKATQYAEVGRFHIFLLIVCLIAFLNVSTVTYILVNNFYAIQCELKLSYEDKAVLNGIVYMGMLFGGVSWSLLADLWSRKWSLIIALVFYSFATIGLAFSWTLYTFGWNRGIGSFCLSGIICITITFISEFQIRIFRGSMICCLQIAWILGMLLITVSWYTWRMTVLMSSIFPLIAGVGLLFIPDAPRFLLSRRRQKAAVKALQIIYTFNTGIYKKDFPIRRLKENKTAAEVKRSAIVKTYIPSYMEPRFICIPLLMLSQFILKFCYYTLAIWFPYMSTRSEAFFPLQMVKIIPSDCRFGINQITENFSSSNIHHGFKIPNGYNSTMNKFSLKSNIIDDPCKINDELADIEFGIMDALACIPSVIWVVVKIDSIGRKFFIILAHVLTGCLAFSAYFVYRTSKEPLFACLFDSLTVLSIAAAHCLAVELFSTRVRVLGVALVTASGQLGAVLANIGGAVSFGLPCAVVVGLTAIALEISGMLMMILPDTTGVFLK